MDKKFIDVKSLASYLNTSVPFVRKLIRNKTLPYYKVGAKIIFDITDVDLWLIENKKQSVREKDTF